MLLGAGAAFALITLVVSIKGVGELRQMLAQLRRRHDEDNTR